MNGLEISRKYYERYVRPMVSKSVPQAVPRMAVGLVGNGSECLGFDDELSRDHDFGPGVCIWLTQEDYALYGSSLANAYSLLPDDIPECRISLVNPEHTSRVGVMCISDFYRRIIGREDPPQTNMEWIRIPETQLCIATNGEVFVDPVGKFSEIRNRLLDFYPEDVQKKKLAAYCFRMGQSGQYNYGRSLKREDYGAAFFALGEFVKASFGALYILNGRYMPFYKWVYRAADVFSSLRIVTDELRAIARKSVLQDGIEIHESIERICESVSLELKIRGWSDLRDCFMLYQAQRVTETITDKELRHLPISFGGI